MLNATILSIFKTTDIAEMNSQKLYEYGNSLNNYFNNTNNSSTYKQYYKWFEKPKLEKSNNSLLKDFKKSFCEFFF